MLPFALLLTAATALTSTVSASPLYTDSIGSTRLAGTKAPLHTFAIDQGIEEVKDGYIVVLKPKTPLNVLTNHLTVIASEHAADSFSQSFGDDEDHGIKNVYDSHTLQGYAGKFSSDLIEKIRQDPMVDFVEKDSIVTTQETEKGAPWGLARLSHRPKLRLSTFTRYDYDSIAGEGVDVYVVDTGINIDHVEFEGRASWGKTIPKNDVDKDGNGHGTHCAGTIASRKYGVAKKAHIIAVKVLGSNGSGSMSDVVDGVLFAAESAVKKAKAAEAEFVQTGYTSHKGSVASMSLGGGKSPALDRAVNKAVESGLHFAVAAGNDNKDACNYSPAAAEKAITVGASEIHDERAYFSNHGSCVDVFGPGLNILSTWNTNNVSTASLSGTSMATPHIAGLAAYFVSLHANNKLDVAGEVVEPTAFEKAKSLLPAYLGAFLPGAASFLAPTPSKKITPEQLKSLILKLSSKNALVGTLPEGTPNLLAFNNYTSI